MLVTATATPSSHAFQTCSSNSAPDRRASLAGRTVRRVERPHLVRPVDGEPAQQVGIHGMAGVCCAGALLPVERRHAHARHQRAHVCTSHVEPLPIQLVAQHTRAHERVLQVQRVQATHQEQIGRADRLGHRVDAAPADPCQLGLTVDRQGVGGVHHRFALSHPTLMSAPSEKSFSSVSCPILACTAFRSTGGSVDAAPPPKISAARSLSGRFHSVISFGCTSNRCASSANVLSRPSRPTPRWL